MNIMNKIREKADNNWDTGAVTIAFLGDSVTQGCFELPEKVDGGFDNCFDKGSTYHRYLDHILSLLYPSVPINMINAGIAGSNASHGLERLERDVLKFQPDLTVVCFGLNDSGNGTSGLESYTTALEAIFIKLEKCGSEIIFMTPNMMNTYVSGDLFNDTLCRIAEQTLETQEKGVLEIYLEAAKGICARRGIKVCDCYATWKRLWKNGVDTTRLLANRINHPSREMNWLFAVSLLDTILEP